MAEAASELRRHLLDRIRDGDLARGSALLDAMGDCYDVLVTVDFPDAITGGLRRATDALRGVLERSRSDVTTTTLQVQLQRAIEGMSKVPLDDVSASVKHGWMDAAAAAAAGAASGPSPHANELDREDEGAILWEIQTVVASNVTIRRGSVAAGAGRCRRSKTLRLRTRSGSRPTTTPMGENYRKPKDPERSRRRT